MKKAVWIGLAASFFFAFTFVINRQMSITGGSWIWSSSLRYVFMLPILFIIVALKRELSAVLMDIKKKPMQWVVWSTIGFGFFYAPLTYASTYGPSWLIAGTWQITIIAGALLSPLFFTTIQTETGNLRIRNKIPIKALTMSFVILAGVLLMQVQEATEVSVSKALIGTLPVIIAAFAYPLGNRKMMEVCENKLNTIQRVFGMTLCSLPFWIILSTFGLFSIGLPSKGQLLQSFIVAICSGVIATVLFFKATNMVKQDAHKLAIVESTQAGEVIFTLLAGILLFSDKMPTLIGFMGIVLVTIGMILNGV